jgi:hypothetical protein
VKLAKALCIRIELRPAGVADRCQPQDGRRFGAMKEPTKGRIEKPIVFERENAITIHESGWYVQKFGIKRSQRRP